VREWISHDRVENDVALQATMMNVAGTRTIGTDMLMRYCQGL
jgi:hypothetical protein